MKYIVIGLIVLTIGCASLDTGKAHRGMTRDEVLQAYGEPDERSFNGDLESWVYSKRKNEWTAIFDREGLVSFGQTKHAPKTSIFKSIGDSMSRSSKDDEHQLTCRKNYADPNQMDCK